VKDNIFAAIVVGLLALVWLLAGICVIAEGVHALLMYVGLPRDTLVFGFVSLTVLVVLLELILRRLR